jgi:glycosyltransferase involved in cell wall biosynthesis
MEQVGSSLVGDSPTGATDTAGLRLVSMFTHTHTQFRTIPTDEEVKLRIRFWEGSYHAGFGSIFPTEDICSLIPADEADVAILEEPEHLNWFRVPPSTKGSDASPTAKEATTLPTEGGSTISSWGWAHKFRFVVGILHTNYGAYMRQYGMGTALVTAPALNSLSALVVRAYCHRVIRLSDTLTSLDPALEVTSNVHGVRDEFLAAPSSDATPEDAAALAPVYFIGKIIWAKGFDSVLELQEAYRERTGCYFGMDVYGGGEDMKSVQRAFFGRRKANKTATSSDDGSSSHGVLSDSEHESGDEKSAAGIFRNPSSLREQVESSGEVAGEVVTKTDDLGPADVFADLSGKTLQSGAETAAETASAALKVVESVLEQGIGAFGLEKSSSSSKSRASKAFSLAPVRSRFKWRKTPLPARFMGVKDHIELRELLAQKIFLNMSTTEVLCTTSAEAMAMGKFVILPRHPSNEFFLKFPNCLAYADLDECVTKLQYALQNDPEPLDEETARMLSWEGATDRLYKASAVMEEEEKAREASGMQKERLKAAKFHLDSCRRSHFVSNLFSGNPIKKLSSKLSSKSDSGD